MKYHAQFLLDKEKNKPDARLRYRIKWQGNILAFNVGYRVEIAKWSEETQRCKTNTTHGKKKIPASIINKEIQRFEDACRAIFAFFEVNRHIPSKEEFKAKFNAEIGRIEKVQYENLFNVFLRFILEEAKYRAWQPASVANYKYARGLLEKFDENLSFSAITHEKIHEFVYFLQSQEVQNSSIKKS